MITIYTRDGCSFCDKAKQIMNENNMKYTEMIIGENIQREEVIQKFPGIKLLPIIVNVDGTLLGGYDALVKHMQQKSA
jgi:glutaredoxin